MNDINNLAGYEERTRVLYMIRSTYLGLGNVLDEKCDPGVVVLEPMPVFKDPFRDIPLLTVVADALELDLVSGNT